MFFGYIFIFYFFQNTVLRAFHKIGFNLYSMFEENILPKIIFQSKYCRFTWNRLRRFLPFNTCTNPWRHTWKIVLDHLRTTSEMTTSWLHWNFQIRRIKETNIQTIHGKTNSVYSFSDQQLSFKVIHSEIK